MGIHGATFSLLPKIDRGIKITGILRGSTLCFHVLPRLYVIVACNISKYSANRTVEVETSGESKTVENLFLGSLSLALAGEYNSQHTFQQDSHLKLRKCEPDFKKNHTKDDQLSENRTEIFASQLFFRTKLLIFSPLFVFLNYCFQDFLF